MWLLVHAEINYEIIHFWTESDHVQNKNHEPTASQSREAGIRCGDTQPIVSVSSADSGFPSLMPRVHRASPKGLHCHTGTQLPVSVLSASWQGARDGRAPRAGSTTLSPEIAHVTSALISLAQASHVASPEFSQAGRYNPPAEKGVMGRKLEHLVNRNSKTAAAMTEGVQVAGVCVVHKEQHPSRQRWTFPGTLSGPNVLDSHHRLSEVGKRHQYILPPRL